MATVKLDVSESLDGYKEDLEKDLQILENEINSISISLAAIPKDQIMRIENLIKESENNVFI
jgi:hypothetical protein